MWKDLEDVIDDVGSGDEMGVDCDGREDEDDDDSDILRAMLIDIQPMGAITTHCLLSHCATVSEEGESARVLPSIH